MGRQRAAALGAWKAALLLATVVPRAHEADGRDAATAVRRRTQQQQQQQQQQGTVPLGDTTQMDGDGDGAVSQEEYEAWGRAHFAPAGVHLAATAGGTELEACPLLLQLSGGCAHDLSLDDEDLPSPTLVSELCPTECSGHGSCAPAAIDVSFLADTRDAGALGAVAGLIGAACVSASGIRFGADGDGEAVMSLPPLSPGAESYAASGEFSVSMWVLHAPADVWQPRAMRSNVGGGGGGGESGGQPGRCAADATVNNQLRSGPRYPG